MHLFSKPTVIISFDCQNLKSHKRQTFEYLQEFQEGFTEERRTPWIWEALPYLLGSQTAEKGEKMKRRWLKKKEMDKKKMEGNLGHVVPLG